MADVVQAEALTFDGQDLGIEYIVIGAMSLHAIDPVNRIIQHRLFDDGDVVEIEPIGQLLVTAEPGQAAELVGQGLQVFGAYR